MKHSTRLTRSFFALAVLWYLAFLFNQFFLSPIILRADYLQIQYLFWTLLDAGDFAGLIRYVFENTSGHFLVLYKLYALLNLWWFDGTLVTTKVIGDFLVILYPLVFVWFFVKRAYHSETVGFGVALCLGVLLTANHNAFEAQMWTDASVAVFPLLIFATLMLHFFCKVLGGEGARRSLVLAGVFGALSLLSVGGGIVVLPTLAVVVLLHTLNSWSGLRPLFENVMSALYVLLITCSPILFLMFVGYVDFTHTGVSDSSLGGISESLPSVVEYTLRLSIWRAYQDASLLNLFFGALCFLLYLYYFLLGVLKKLPAQSIFWFGLATFGLGNAAVIALARHQYFDQLGFLPSNYSAYTTTYLVGLLGVTYLVFKERVHLREKFSVVGSVALSMGLLLAGTHFFFQQEKSLVRAEALSKEMKQTASIAPNWNMTYMMRMNGSAPNLLLPYFRDFLPAIDKSGWIPELSDRFVSEQDPIYSAIDFLSDWNDKKALYEDRFRVCRGEKEGIYGELFYLEPEIRFGLDKHAAEFPLHTFVGYVSNPLNCGQQVDRVFLVDDMGRLICGAATSGLLYDIPDELLRGELLHDKDAFEFSCPLNPAIVEAQRFYLFGWLEEERLPIPINSSLR